MTGYALIDSGDRYKLERFAGVTLIRPSSQALWPRRDPARWSEADATFERDRGGNGRWSKRGASSTSWRMTFAGVTWNLRRNDHGNLGIFPEQAPCWNWIETVLAARTQTDQVPEVLNLFAYTGGSTFAAARGGARVVHLDASKTSVAVARENAESSGLADRPIRWITDDALKFVRREVKRGRRYQGIVLDPPSYGRGSGSEVWKIEESIGELLDRCRALLADDACFVLFTSHSPGFTPDRSREPTRGPVRQSRRVGRDDHPGGRRKTASEWRIRAMEPRVIDPLSSLQNPRVKNTVKLRARRERDKQRRFLIEGYRELRRAVDAKLPIAELFICPDVYLGENEPALVADAKSRCGAAVIPVVANVFQKLSYRDRPDGLLATAPIPSWTLSEWQPKAKALYVIAVTLEKPGNLGTILRTADAVGADGVIVCDRCTDVFNPNVVRASVGTLFTVPVAETRTEDLLPWLARNKIEIVATTPAADVVYTAADLTGSIALTVGCEQYGLPERWLEAAARRVAIPMAGDADSLNAAVATAVVLFEAARQRR